MKNTMSKRRARLSPEAEAIHFILSGSDKPCLKVQWISDYKGRGVFACAPIEKGSFVAEYRGELISKYERDKRQKKYTQKQNAFLFDFEWNNDVWSIDASKEDDSCGRLVNDSHKSPNCKMKRLIVQGKPHLCLFAMENIQAESEITYNYGDAPWPWRALTPSAETPTQPPAEPEMSGPSTSSFQQTPSAETPTQPPAEPEMSGPSTSSFQQTPSAETPTQPPAEPEMSGPSTSSFQQTPSAETPTQPPAEPEMSGPSTSSFQQTPSAETPTQPPAEPEMSGPSTSSFQQTPSAETPTQPPAEPEMSGPSTSSFQQTPSAETPTQPPAEPEMSGPSTSSFQQTPSAETPTQPPAEPEMSGPSTSSFQQTPSAETPTQPPAEPEMSGPSTSSFQQTPSAETPTQPPAEPEMSGPSTSSFQQTPSAETPTQPPAEPEMSGPSTSSFQQTPSAETPTQPPAEPEMSGPSTSSFQQTPSAETPTQPPAEPEMSGPSTSSFQQTPSAETPTQPPAEPEMSGPSTSSFQQTPSAETPTQPPAEPEMSGPSTSSFQQTPSAETPTQPPAEPEMSGPSTSSFQQVSQTSGFVPVHEIVTGEQFRAISRLQNRKRHHAQCEEHCDDDKMKILKKERQRTLSISTRMNVGHAEDEDGGFPDGDYSSFSDQISDSEFSDNTSYEDIDYIPDSSGNSSDTSVHSSELRVTDNSPKKLLDISLRMATSHSAEIADSHSSSVISCSADSTESISHNNSSIKVTPLPKGRRESKYNKKQYCLYCKKPISKLARHLESAHSNQPDVAMAFRFAKGSHKRRELLRCLKKRGNFEHNASVAVQGTGAFVACRRPTIEKQPEDYRHCKFCQGLYARESLWRHVRRCPQKPVEGESPTGRKRIQLDLPKPNQVHEAVWKIACEMNQDDISFVVKDERDILSLGESLYNSRKPHERRNDYIRQKMREMARLLIEARGKTPLMRTEDLVMPSNFPHVIQAVRAVAGYDFKSNSYKVPSLALKLGHSLAKLAGIVQCNAIIAHRHDVAESAKQFATLYHKKWAESISAAALGTLQQAKWNKPQLLPFTQDVSLLHQFLAAECAKCMKDVEEKPNNTNFGNLAKVTLTQVVLFNRKRQGEVSKMEVQAFTSRNCTELNPDIMMCLNELERNLAKYFDRVEIRGKRSRMVPVLLTPDMITAMNLLMENRSKCQVPAENVYFFARPGALSHYRGSDCLRKYAKQCGAKNPEALTSTRLRKQVATLSTVLNLKENEMDQLATFLGHDVRIHREFYRLPESTIQLAKVSKLLIAMEKGKLADLQGKGLDDIDIHPDDKVATTDDDSDEETIPDPNQQRDSRPETSGDPKHLPDSSILSNMEATTDAVMLDHLEGMSTQSIISSEPADSQQDTAITVGTSSLKCSKKQAGKVRSKWTDDEVKAVERHMLHFITSCKVPGKRDCDACLQEEPVALKDRDWAGLKYYIHNRIVALKRRMNK